jgi:hypothetical protein
MEDVRLQRSGHDQLLISSPQPNSFSTYSSLICAIRDESWSRIQSLVAQMRDIHLDEIKAAVDNEVMQRNEADESRPLLLPIVQ